jgi:murein DD-endopeptidase MepM/ murein hydrolase activator NlpD
MATLLQRYKGAERAAYKRSTAALSRAFRAAASAWKSFLREGRQSVSILVVAHSEAPPRGIRISLFGLAGLCFLAASIVVLVFAFSGSLGGARAKVSASSDELVQAQDELNSLREQASRLTKAYQDFEDALDPITSGSISYKAQLGPKGLDISSLFAKRSSEALGLAEIRESLDRSAPIVSEYGTVLGQMDAVKRTVPAIWPIGGNQGHISTIFGTNANPFTGQSYFHTGIDCSTYRSGDPVVSTADGKVIFAGVQGGYGRCVIVAHAYDYVTRYGHMERILVHSGQMVKQGQAIGLVGNTGTSTGPHTHYEVIMGRHYLDPTDFLWAGAKSHPIIDGGSSFD